MTGRKVGGVTALAQGRRGEKNGLLFTRQSMRGVFCECSAAKVAENPRKTGARGLPYVFEEEVYLSRFPCGSGD